MFLSFQNAKGNEVEGERGKNPVYFKKSLGILFSAG